MHMVVKGDLVPLLRHLQQMKAAQLVAYQAGFARGRGAEIVGQLQLFEVVPVGPDNLLHDLHQDAGRILGQRSLGRIDHLFAQGPQSLDAVVHTAYLQGAEQVNDRIGNSQAFGLGHLLDSLGVKIGIIETAGMGIIAASAQHVVDDPDQVMVPAVK